MRIRKRKRRERAREREKRGVSKTRRGSQGATVVFFSFSFSLPLKRLASRPALFGPLIALYLRCNQLETSLTDCCFLSGASRNAEGERRAAREEAAAAGEAIARCIFGLKEQTKESWRRQKNQLWEEVAGQQQAQQRLQQQQRRGKGLGNERKWK